MSGSGRQTAATNFDRTAHFACVPGCGACCRQTKIPLTAREATGWLDDGHAVQVICEAWAWRDEPAAADERAAHVRRRSFPAVSGTLPIRVIAILAADLPEDCPNLRPDRRCGIYERRPLVCRIYPAEINPFIDLDPARKACPPSAWSAEHPLLLRHGRIVDDALRTAIECSRASDAHDALLKQRVCAALDISAAAVAEEGFVVHSPDRGRLRDALAGALRSAEALAAPGWRLVSNQATTLESLALEGAHAAAPARQDVVPFAYLGFRPQTASGAV